MASFCAFAHTHTHLFREINSRSRWCVISITSKCHVRWTRRTDRPTAFLNVTLRFFLWLFQLRAASLHIPLALCLFQMDFSRNVFLFFFTKFWIISLGLNWKLTFFIIPKLFFLFRSCTHLNRVSRGWPVSHPVSFFFINVFFFFICVAWS